jgi:hypothetical protein
MEIMAVAAMRAIIGIFTTRNTSRTADFLQSIPPGFPAPPDQSGKNAGRIPAVRWWARTLDAWPEVRAVVFAEITTEARQRPRRPDRNNHR